MKNKKLILIAALVLAVLTAVAAVSWMAFAPEAVEGRKSLTIQVTHGSGQVNTIALETQAEYLGEALMAEGLVAGEESAYGLYVRTVDGETADEAAQQWWGYTRNGEYVEYGVDQCPIQDGEQYEFTLNAGW